MIGIFNRSHYEDVVTVGVLGLAPEVVWRQRRQRIVEFERMLAEEGTTVLKCFLHVSAEEQRERFAERLSDPTKRWKHNPKDEETSRRFGKFTAAYAEALTIDGVGALVRDTCVPQLGAKSRGRNRARQGAATTRSAVPNDGGVSTKPAGLGTSPRSHPSRALENQGCKCGRRGYSRAWIRNF